MVKQLSTLVRVATQHVNFQYRKITRAMSTTVNISIIPRAPFTSPEISSYSSPSSSGELSCDMCVV